MNTTNIVNEALNTLLKYENIATVIPLNEIEEKWVNKLNKANVAYLLNGDSILNLLKLGWGLSNNFDRSNDHYATILYNLNQYLKLLKNKDSKVIKNYADKLLNIEGVHIFSTLSELALANYYSSNNYQVNFFYPFSLQYKNKESKNRDVDLEISSDEEKFLVEVYMPTYTPDCEDVFHGDSLIEIADIKNHLFSKLINKFDLNEHPKIIGIDDPLFLAVNIKYDSMLLSQVYPPFNFNKKADDIFMRLQDVFKESLSSIVRENSFLSGIILFETDFFVKNNKVLLHKPNQI